MWPTDRGDNLEFLDGETYLRLLVERVVDEVGSRRPDDAREIGWWLSEYHRASEALVAAEAVDHDTAEAIRADLTLALALRAPAAPGGLEPQQRSRWHRSGPPASAPVGQPAQPPARRTARACAADVETPDGILHVQFVVITDGRAELFATAVTPGGGPVSPSLSPSPPATAPGPRLSVQNVHRRTWTSGRVSSFSTPPPPTPAGRRLTPVPPPRPAPASVSRRRLPGRPGGPHVPSLDQIQVFDDDGQEYVARGGSSGGDGVRWAFRLHLVPPLREGTTALTFQAYDGKPVRVELAAPPAGVRVGPIEDIPPEERWSPAERYLVEAAQRSFQWWRRAQAHGGQPAPSVDDAATAALLATGAIHPASPAIAMRTALAKAQVGQPPPPGLPERWASVLFHLDADDGLEATAAVGAALPVLAGRHVWLDAVASEPATWRLHAFVQPGTWGPGREPFGLSEPSFTAHDDRGGFYAGVLDGAGGGADGMNLTFRFVPRLDPRARHVTVEATSEGRRVIVTIPLPEPWGRAP